MKQLFINILVLSVIGLTSCKKSDLSPSEELTEIAATTETTPGKEVSRWGKFVITDAVMYVQNHETGENTKYNHFDDTKSRSSLRYGGSIYDIETIIKDTTSYSFYSPINFPGIGKFVLNGDTTKHYGVSYTKNFTTIVEDPLYIEQNMGGSARPYIGKTIDADAGVISIQIQEVEGSIDGYNVRYWTVLTLIRVEAW